MTGGAANLLVGGGAFTGLAALIAAITALVKVVLNGGGIRAELTAQMNENNKQRSEFQKKIEDRADDCDKQCRELRREVEEVRGELYTVLEGFEDRVVPKISDDVLKAEARKIIHDARANLRRKLIGSEGQEA